MGNLELPVPTWQDDGTDAPVGTPAAAGPVTPEGWSPDGLLGGLDLSGHGGGAGSLSLLMDPKDIATVSGLPGADDGAGSDSSLTLMQEARATNSQRAAGQSGPVGGRQYNPYDQTRPELERMAKDPTIAKAIDDYYSRSQYANPKDYRGEPSFDVLEDSSGHLLVQPRTITGYSPVPNGIKTQYASPSIWDDVQDFLLNRKPVASFHAHPNGGQDWVTGPSGDDQGESWKRQLPGIIKAPDGLHYHGVPTPQKPAPFHGLFDWF